MSIMSAKAAASRSCSTSQGLTTAVGVGAVHVAPDWADLVDSYAAADADALSWLIAAGDDARRAGADDLVAARAHVCPVATLPDDPGG